MSNPNLEVFKSLPTPDVIKLMDRVAALDSTVKGQYVGCFSTAGEIKTDCPILTATVTSDFGLDGTYVRTDYPDWIFLPGMNFTHNNHLTPRPDLKYNIPRLLETCNSTIFNQLTRCIMVNTWGTMNDEIGDTQLHYEHNNDKFPQLGGTWINRAYAEQHLQLGLAPQTKSG